MKKIIGLLVLLLFVSGVSNATVAKKNKKKVINPIELKKDSVNADYKKVTKDAVSKKGLFTTFLSKKENNLYFEIPDSAFSHTYLLANRIAETSNTQDYVAGQMATTPLMIRFSKDDQKVYMHLVQSSNIVDRNDPILPAFDKNFADPVLKGFKIVARNMDNVVIDVTSFFGGNEKCISPIKQESPLAKLFGGGNSLKGTFASDASNILSVKTFPNNIEIKSLLSFTTTPLNQPYSVTVHRSLFVLPDTLMPMRLQDNRVGYFSSDKSLYTSSKDKIVPQTFIHRWRLEPQKDDLEKFITDRFHTGRFIAGRFHTGRFLSSGIYRFPSAVRTPLSLTAFIALLSISSSWTRARRTYPSPDGPNALPGVTITPARSISSMTNASEQV